MKIRVRPPFPRAVCRSGHRGSQPGTRRFAASRYRQSGGQNRGRHARGWRCPSAVRGADTEVEVRFWAGQRGKRDYADAAGALLPRLLPTRTWRCVGIAVRSARSLVAAGDEALLCGATSRGDRLPDEPSARRVIAIWRRESASSETLTAQLRAYRRSFPMRSTPISRRSRASPFGDDAPGAAAGTPASGASGWDTKIRRAVSSRFWGVSLENSEVRWPCPCPCPEIGMRWVLVTMPCARLCSRGSGTGTGTGTCTGGNRIGGRGLADCPGVLNQRGIVATKRQLAIRRPIRVRKVRERAEERVARAVVVAPGGAADPALDLAGASQWDTGTISTTPSRW